MIGTLLKAHELLLTLISKKINVNKNKSLKKVENFINIVENHTETGYPIKKSTGGGWRSWEESDSLDQISDPDYEPIPIERTCGISFSSSTDGIYPAFS